VSAGKAELAIDIVVAGANTHVKSMFISRVGNLTHLLYYHGPHETWNIAGRLQKIIF